MAAQIDQENLIINYFEKYTSSQLYELDSLSQKFFKSGDNQEIQEFTERIIYIKDCYIGTFNNFINEFKKNTELVNKLTMTNHKVRRVLNDYFTRIIFRELFEELKAGRFRNVQVREITEIVSHKSSLFGKRLETDHQIKVFKRICKAYQVMFGETKIAYSWTTRIYRILVYRAFKSAKSPKLKLERINCERIFRLAKKILLGRDPLIQKSPWDNDAISAAYLLLFKSHGAKIPFRISFNPLSFEKGSSADRKAICDQKSKKNIRPEEIVELVRDEYKAKS